MDLKTVSSFESRVSNSIRPETLDCTKGRDWNCCTTNPSDAATAKVPALDLPELYQCVHCGLCLNQCPTYRALHLEPESPRGRIHLVKAAAEGRIELNDRFKEHIYLCLLCRACETACPSGVQYGRIAETAREQLGPPGSPFARALLNFVFTRLLPLSAAAAFCLRSAAFLPTERAARARANALAGQVARNGFDAACHPVKVFSATKRISCPPSARAALKSPCSMDASCRCLFGDVNEATVRVLRRNGCDVVLPKKQICCGALNIHNGESVAAKQMARRNIDVFLDSRGRRDHRQRRRLRRGNERIWLLVARRSRLSRQGRAFQRAGQGCR